jgi:hypothetical protein
MVTRPTTRKPRAAARRPAPRAAGGLASAAPTMTPQMAEMKARFEVAGRALQRAGKAASRFARRSVHEVTLATRASREPMQALWRAMRLAGRHIARDAVVAWQEAVPARPRGKKAAPRPAARAA